MHTANKLWMRLPVTYTTVLAQALVVGVLKYCPLGRTDFSGVPHTGTMSSQNSATALTSKNGTPSQTWVHVGNLHVGKCRIMHTQDCFSACWKRQKKKCLHRPFTWWQWAWCRVSLGIRTVSASVIAQPQPRHEIKHQLKRNLSLRSTPRHTFQSWLPCLSSFHDQNKSNFATIPAHNYTKLGLHILWHVLHTTATNSYPDNKPCRNTYQKLTKSRNNHRPVRCLPLHEKYTNKQLQWSCDTHCNGYSCGAPRPGTKTLFSVPCYVRRGTKNAASHVARNTENTPTGEN